MQQRTMRLSETGAAQSAQKAINRILNEKSVLKAAHELPSNHFSKRRARTLRSSKEATRLLIPDEGRITPAKVDQLQNYSSMVLASNFKFDTRRYGLRHNKSVSLPHGFLNETAVKPPFKPMFARSLDGGSLHLSSRFNKVERTAEDQTSLTGESFSDLVSDEGTHQKLFESTLVAS